MNASRTAVMPAGNSKCRDKIKAEFE